MTLPPVQRVEPDRLLERLLRANLPVDVMDIPAELREAVVRDLILRDLDGDGEAVEGAADPQPTRETDS